MYIIFVINLDLVYLIIPLYIFSSSLIRKITPTNFKTAPITNLGKEIPQLEYKMY